MAQQRQSRPDRELDKFVESQSRPTHTAVDVVVGNNADNPVPVILADDSYQGEILNEFDEASSVPSSTPTTVVSYTVPVGKILYLREIEVDGGNIAHYTVKRDANEIASKRTWFAGGLGKTFNFYGLKFVSGEIITVTVEHFRPDVSNHEARIIGNLV